MSEIETYEEFEEIDERPFNRAHFRRIVAYLGPHRRAVTIAAVGIVLGAGVTLFEPYLIGRVVDVGVVGHDWPGTVRLALLMVLLRLAAWVGGTLRIRAAADAGQGVLFDLRQQLFEHIQHLSLRFYDRHPVGRIMSRITSDVEAIATLLNTGLVTLIAEGIGLVGILAVMLWMSWQLTLISFVTMPLLIALVYFLRTRLQTSWKNVRKAVANISTNLNESVSGIAVTQAFSREGQNIDQFGELTVQSHETWMRAVNTDEAIWPAIEVIGVLGTALVIIAGAWLVLADQLTLGFVMAFIGYQWLFWEPLSAMSKVYGQTLSAMASAERIFDFLDTVPEVSDRPEADPLPPVVGAVRFDHVNFRYHSEQPLILADINLDVAPGETVALVGHTGSGKTSIVSLLMRFYDPVGGAICIDGRDLRDIQLADLRRQTAIVLQDGFVFSGTLAENIRYGRLDAGDAEVRAVAQAVGLDAFVQSLDEGYAYDVGERGSRLSVGQRQLIAFARALLADPAILILDEATSNVDTETELLIQQAMERLLRGRTAFIIAHRLSTIRHADKIVVLDHGRIVEVGTHAELLAADGRYAALYLTQFAGRSPLAPDRRPATFVTEEV